MLETVLAAIRGAHGVVVITGAGMSQESGVPTFRDARTGLWSQYDPSEFATEAAFRRHPSRVFGWYLWRWRVACQAMPHGGYGALVRLEHVFDDFLVVTQNVDGLHQRAGSRAVTELHGSLGAFRCLDEGHPFDAQLLVGIDVPEDGEVDPPACPACGSPIRPGVVWFGEVLPRAALKRATLAIEACDVVCVVGTSGLVYPAASLAWAAIERGRIVIEINPNPTPLTAHASVAWPANAGAALPLLADALGAQSRGA